MFKLEFSTDNSAFGDEGALGLQKMNEVSRILQAIATKVGTGYVSGPVKDINGNTVGVWSLS